MNKDASITSIIVRAYTIAMFMAMPAIIFVGFAALVIHIVIGQ